MTTNVTPSAGTMLALSLTGPSSIAAVEVAVPIARPHEVVVSVGLVGICGSEIHDSMVLAYRRPPIIMGHEITGRLSDGTRVAVNPLIACGTCDYCRSDRGNLCASRVVLGIHRPGGFASYVVVSRSQVFPLPNSVSDGQGVMAEPLANALHAWRLSAASIGTRVGIIGAGPIGLSVALTAARHRVAMIDVIEPNRIRQSAAIAIGATVHDEFRRQYDVVFDCVGSARSHSMSTEALANGGTAVWLGLESQDAVLDCTGLVRGEKSIRGSYGYTQMEFETALEMAPEVPLAWIEERPLADGPEIFRNLWRGNLTVPKIALRPKHRGSSGD